MRAQMKKLLLTALSTVVITSCATQGNVALGDAYWQNKSHHVVVATANAPEPGVTKIGSQGLLDLAINQAMTNKLDTHVSKTTDVTWYYALSNELADKLKKQHVKVSLANHRIESDKTDMTSIAAEHQVEEVLILKLKAVGVIRRYSGFIPMGAPQAYCALQGELVDTRTKAVLWHHDAEVKLPIQGEWDQPPAYPNVTTTIKEAVTTSRQEIIDSLFSGR
jgi:hypothetical protein